MTAKATMEEDMEKLKSTCEEKDIKLVQGSDFGLSKVICDPHMKIIIYTKKATFADITEALDLCKLGAK